MEWYKDEEEEEEEGRGKKKRRRRRERKKRRKEGKEMRNAYLFKSEVFLADTKPFFVDLTK